MLLSIHLAGKCHCVWGNSDVERQLSSKFEGRNGSNRVSSEWTNQRLTFTAELYVRQNLLKQLSTKEGNMEVEQFLNMCGGATMSRQQPCELN